MNRKLPGWNVAIATSTPLAHIGVRSSRSKSIRIEYVSIGMFSDIEP